MSIKLKGSSDGSVSFDAPADTSPSGSDITLVLPTTVGSAEQFLKNSGTAGTLEFSSMVETSTGVGIGTSSPSGLLHLAASSEPSLYFEDTGSSNTLSRVYKSGSSLTFNSRHTSAGQFVFNSENSGGTATERMRIDQSGNVGIGTTSPGVPLNVQGLIRAQRSDDALPSNLRSIQIGCEGSVGSLDTVSNGGTNLILRFRQSSDGGSSFTERMRIDSSGNVGIATSTISGANLVIATNSNGGSGIKLIGKSANGGAEIDFRNNADSTLNGFIEFNDSGGILSTVVNQPQVFRTNNAERARITSNGYFLAANSASYLNSSGVSHEFNQSGNTETLAVRATNSSYSSQVCTLYAVRAATSSYWFFRGVSSSGSASADNEFYIKGDGNAYADGSWSGGGADYAEYFEWSDGNTEAEDRRGISVVLDGDKIREAVTGEEPIGVISGNPSVVGDVDMDRWKGKYLRDDYGSYVLDEDGYRQLNPDFDSSIEYVQREDRPEWDTVGLMGKLRIRKGQVTGTRWIKMRDVSDTVEEWLVR